MSVLKQTRSSYSFIAIAALAFVASSSQANTNAALVLATTKRGPPVTAADIDIALTGLSDEEKRVYLSAPERVAILAERLALAFEMNTAEARIPKELRAAGKVEGALARYTFARREATKVANRVEASTSPVKARARELYLGGHRVCDTLPVYTGAHIFVRADNRPLKEALAKVDRIVSTLKTGKSFGDVAKAESDDVESAKNEGSLLTFTRESIDRQFAREFFSDLTPGRVSEPFFTRFGIHILKVGEQRSSASRLSFESCEAALVRIVEADLADKIMLDLQTQIVAESGLKINEDAVAVVAKANAPDASASQVNQTQLIENAVRLYEQQRSLEQRPASKPAPVIR